MHIFESKNVCAYDKQINFDKFFVDFIGYRIMNHRSIFMDYICNYTTGLRSYFPFLKSVIRRLKQMERIIFTKFWNCLRECVERESSKYSILK